MKNKICDSKDFPYFLLLIIFLLEGYFSPFQPSLALKLKMTVNNFMKRYHKIPKISPSMYKPLHIEASQIWNTKIPPISSLQIQAPGGLYLEIILINTNQSKLNIITTIRKSFLVIKELFHALKQCVSSYRSLPNLKHKNTSYNKPPNTSPRGLVLGNYPH